MALRLLDVEPDAQYRFVFTPTGNEFPALFEHMGTVRMRVGPERFKVLARESLTACIRRNKMIPNFRARFCTRELKIIPYANYLGELIEQGSQVVSCVGIRFDEPERETGDYLGLPGIEQRFPLREWKWSLKEVREYLASQGIVIPDRTDCAMCFYQRIGEWWNLWKDHPEMFAEALALEKEFGHTFRSPTRDTWPAGLKELAERFSSGAVPRGANINADLFDDSASTRCRVCRM